MMSEQLSFAVSVMISTSMMSRPSPQISKITSQWSTTHRTEAEGDQTANTETAPDTAEGAKWLSAPTAMLLAIVFLSAFSGDLYASSYPVTFAEDFGISSTVGGYLNAAACVFGYFVLRTLLQLSGRFTLCQYPWDVIVCSMIAVLSGSSYFVFYEKWIAFSFHWIIRKMHIVLMGEEMVARLFLCPPAAFAKVTSIGGTLKTIGYLAGGFLGPFLLSVSKTLPFVTVSALYLTTFTVVALVYGYRRHQLSEMDFDDDVKGQYLLMERARNSRGGTVEQQELDRAHVAALKTMISRTVTATDLMPTTSV